MFQIPDNSLSSHCFADKVFGRTYVATVLLNTRTTLDDFGNTGLISIETHKLTSYPFGYFGELRLEYDRLKTMYQRFFQEHFGGGH